MKSTVPLKENHLFQRAYRKGKTCADGCLVLYVRRNGKAVNRLGLTVSTKVGHAVVRNRIRRRLREIYRLHESELKTGTDLVVVARVRASGSSYRQLEQSFLNLSRRLDLLNGDL